MRDKEHKLKRIEGDTHFIKAKQSLLGYVLDNKTSFIYVDHFQNGIYECDNIFKRYKLVPKFIKGEFEIGDTCWRIIMCKIESSKLETFYEVMKDHNRKLCIKYGQDYLSINNEFVKAMKKIGVLN